jgi:hypothetical protein
MQRSQYERGLDVTELSSLKKTALVDVVAVNSVTTIRSTEKERHSLYSL